MHKDDSSSYVERLRSRFHSNPVGMRVVLPDGTDAMIKAVYDTPRGKEYEVRGVHPGRAGRFRSRGGARSRYVAAELELRYFEASVRQVGV